MISKEDVPSIALKYSNKESRLSFTQKGKTYVLENKQKEDILGFWVDGKLILSTEKTRKCDCAVVVKQEDCYLIELKGKDIDEACEQLSCTMKYFKKYNMYKFLCRIVVSKINTHKTHDEKFISFDKEIRTMCKKYKMNYKQAFKYGESRFEEEI